MSANSSGYRRFTATHTPENEYDDDEDASSTSTAGPPPPHIPQSTGRFVRPTWAFPSAESEGSSLTSSCNIRPSQANQTGSFQRGGLNGSMNTGSFPARGAHNRTTSTTSASVSPSGSVAQEWGRSFRLFSTARYFHGNNSTSHFRGREDTLHQSVLRSSFFGNRFAPQSGLEGSFYPRQSSVFSVTSAQLHGTNGGVTGNASATGNSYANVQLSPEMRGTSLIFSTGSPAPMPPINLLSSFAGMAGPLSLSRPGPSLALHAYATGMSTNPTSGSQRELPLLLNTLRNHISLTGKTIIVGDMNHPMEIVRGPVIGFGGFASVYAGINTVRGELLAIKEINIDGVDDVQALNGIEEEFGLLKSLRHPNIVKYYFFEHSRSQKVCRIVMELLAGDSTLNLLQKFGPLTETVLRNITRHLLRAISFIHREGIFHRDIKPANILLSHRGEVKLCDFGCSKRVSELNKASSCILGTPVYMSPEMIKGEGSHKSDIWAMGCSLFELATGFQPWYHSGLKDHLKLMFYISTTSETPLVVPSQDNVPDFSPEFMNFLDACFNRNVDRRPEASTLLNHPWVTGAGSSADIASRVIRTPPAAPLLPDTSGAREVTLSPRSNTIEGSLNSSRASTEAGLVNHVSLVETELFCMQELEEISATIAADLCATLMNAQTYAAKSETRNGDETGVTSFDTSPQLTRTLSGHSQRAQQQAQQQQHQQQQHSQSQQTQPSQQPSQQPSPSHSRSPLHPLPPSMSLGDMMSFTEVQDHSLVNDTFQFNQLGLGASAGNFVLPAELVEQPTQQFLRINEEGNLDLAAFPDDAVIDETMSHGDGRSRVTSPSRESAAARSISGGTGPLTHSFLGASGPSPFSNAVAAAGSPAASSRDADSNAFSQLATSMSFRPLPEKARPQADGKLHMSLAVNEDVNLELNVDVADVHCKVVDNRPNYVVAFTDDIRNQIANKIKEVSEQQQQQQQQQQRPRSESGHGAGGSVGANSNSNTINNATDSPITRPRRPSGNHFYNSPSFLSAARSPRRLLSHQLPAGSQFSSTPPTVGGTPVGEQLHAQQGAGVTPPPIHVQLSAPSPASGSSSGTNAAPNVQVTSILSPRMSGSGLAKPKTTGHKGDDE